MSKKRKPGGNRQAGNRYERALVFDFKDLGYLGCKTSRFSNRLLDYCKVDLNLPYLNVQAKYVKNNVNYLEIFDSMKKLLHENYPERENFISTIFHKRGAKEIVVMTKEDFYRIWKIITDNNLMSNL